MTASIQIVTHKLFMIFSSPLPLKMKKLDNVRINNYLSEFVGYTPNLSHVNFLLRTGNTV